MLENNVFGYKITEIASFVKKEPAVPGIPPGRQALFNSWKSHSQADIPIRTHYQPYTRQVMCSHGSLLVRPRGLEPLPITWSGT